MKSLCRKSLFLVLLTFTFYAPFTAVADILAPVIFMYSGPNLKICEKATIMVDFTLTQGVPFDNVFTIEIAPDGDFSGPVVTFGSVSAGASVQCRIVTDFPANLLENTDYKIRIKGSNPVAYSPGNQHTFQIRKVLPFIPEFYPEGYWRGTFYKWTPTTPAVILDGNTQDIFNPQNYLGYVTEDSQSFEYNYGIDNAAPGNLFDSNFVCGSYLDNYSIRMKRKINFEDGFYVFGGGGDDGFRLSLDGGVTWIVDLWYDHELLGKMENGGCGVHVSAGPKDVVAEYYENKTHSRFQVIIKKTGDPSVNPLQILNPAQGSAVCISASPFQMSSNANGGQWYGPGVSPSGIFNPQIAGTGFKTINYETGHSAFGSNCLKTISVTFNVVPGVSANFSGLDTAYCQSADTVTLVPGVTGGSFLGPGILGNSFIPSLLSPGIVSVGYALPASNGCLADTVRKNVNIRTAPDAAFSGLPDTVCVGAANIQLVPVVSGGTFSGDGVIPFNNQFVPSVLTPGQSYLIGYSVTQNTCKSISEQSVYVTSKYKPVVAFLGMRVSYCSNGPAFFPVTTPASRLYLGVNEIQEIDPGMLSAGNYTLKAVHFSNTSETCMDSASSTFQFSIIETPKPDLGPDKEIEYGTSLTLDPKITSNYTWHSDPVNANFEAGKPITLVAAQDISVSVLSSDASGICTASDTIFVKVRPQIEFPNLFTPNGDTHNDQWVIKGAVTDMKITIYNRWGKEIYSGTNEGEVAWKGPTEKESGMYFYLVEHPTDGRKWNGWLVVQP